MTSRCELYQGTALAVPRSINKQRALAPVFSGRQADAIRRVWWFFDPAFLLPGGAVAAERRQGRKTPRSSCRVACWKWSSFYAIAVLLELLDHSGNARALGFGAHLMAPFLVADPPVQNYPEQSVKSVGDGPDGLFVSQARQQLPKRDVKDATLDLDCGLRCLIQQPPHGAVALRRTRTLGLAGALFAPRTCSHPRRQGLLRFKSRRLGTHFGDHLDRRIHPEAGHFRQSLHRVLMLLE